VVLGTGDVAPGTTRIALRLPIWITRGRVTCGLAPSAEDLFAHPLRRPAPGDPAAVEGDPEAVSGAVPLQDLVVRQPLQDVKDLLAGEAEAGLAPRVLDARDVQLTAARLVRGPGERREDPVRSRVAVLPVVLEGDVGPRLDQALVVEIALTACP